MKQTKQTTIHAALEARARELAAMTPGSGNASRTKHACACQPPCGAMTYRTWAPGHDAKQLSRMVEALREEAINAAIAEAKKASK